MTELIQTWSKNTSEEDSMTEEHAWIWREMIKCIPSNDLSAARVLDVGCNQGGFLRTLYDTRPFAQGVGVDLAAGGHYDAVTCCHADNPLWATWRAKLSEMSNIPVPNHSVADIATAFRAAGFDVSISRFLADAFIPTEAPSDYFPTELTRLDVYTQWKLCFRCTKP